MFSPESGVGCSSQALYYEKKVCPRVLEERKEIELSGTQTSWRITVSESVANGGRRSVPLPSTIWVDDQCRRAGTSPIQPESTCHSHVWRTRALVLPLWCPGSFVTSPKKE